MTISFLSALVHRVDFLESLLRKKDRKALWRDITGFFMGNLHFFWSGSEVEEDNKVGIQRIVHLVHDE
jgi:hypothetical protein